ncbi:hypothetical protein CALVIDRAFT_529731 [Calocera viscosa TUFC12733]|uniref:Uncharacterized protein n=1 Tax=Calocera viscosa (strain TUFC12733) TaxID=1330018 RepID=A0A167IZG8_CALVF|nr:hypothetical protein CALVIDRAFT_529731 [Calocera viscosa TUFC12733]
MSANASLPLLYALYRLINPPLPTPLDYLPLIFRLLALSIAGPFLFITCLEVAGYLIVRTLGFTTRVPSASAPQSGTVSPSSEPSSLPLKPIPLPVPPAQKLSDAHRTLAPPQLLIPAPSSRLPEKYETYFATPGEHGFELSGTGLFSPPDSREGSPPHSALEGSPRSALDIGVGVGGGKSSALGLVGDGVEIRSRQQAINGLKALTPVEAR